MNINNLIKKKFKMVIIGVEAGELLFRQNDALKVIEEIEKLHGVILGLDFWQRTKDCDVMEVNSTNWDNINKGLSASKDTIETAKELIGNGLPDNADYVSFVIKDQEVESK
jgi:hypothetical protein